MNIFQKVTLKTLKENKTRTIVTIIGIILSLSMFTAVTTSISSFRNYLLEITKIREGNWHGSVSVDASDREALLKDDDIDTVSFLEHIGYVRLADSINPDKPYLFLGGMDKAADGTLPIIITDGRMPENENELLLPNHLSYNGGVNYSLNDTVTLEIGDRLSTDTNGKSYSLSQNTPYLYTKEELRAQGLSDSTIADRDTESFSPRFRHTYTVVGFYERPSIEPFTAPGYTALTVSATPNDADADDSAAVDDTVAAHDIETGNSKSYTAYIRFGNPKDAIPWLEKHYPCSYETNSDLLRMYAASYESSYNSVLYGMALVLIFIILFGSISLIYNAFSISVTERTRQFGLLASLGATKKQLVRSVLFEAFSLCVIGIPLGILAGIVGIGITFSLLGSSISDILWGNWAIPLTLHVSPWSVAAAAAIGLFTVLISAYLPARRSAKLSPIDAIRMTTDIRIRPGKVRTSRLTYRLFGLSGMLASKNFKRNRRKYRATVISLFVSVVLFISASSFCSYLMNAADNIISDAGCDITYYRYGDDQNITNDEILERLSGLEGITEAAWVRYSYAQIYLKASALTEEYRETLSGWYPEGNITDSRGQIALNTQIFFVDDNSYAAYLKEAGLSPSVFLNPERPIAVASDFCRFYNGDSGRYSAFHLLSSDSASGSILQIQAPEGYEYNGYYTDENNNYIYYFYSETDYEGEGLELPASSCATEVPLTIGAVCENIPFFLGSSYSNGLILLYPASAMETVLGESQTAYAQENSVDFFFTAEDHKSATADISEALKNMGLNSSAVYDYAENAAQERTLIMVITVFSYGFIILISLIAMANVFNTISTNLQLRKREFAMLKSTGMTPKGFRIMMCYECLLYGIKGLLYGLPVSILVTFWIYRSISDGWEVGFYIPWYSLVIAIGSVFLVVGSTMVYSMHKIGKENIMDNLKNENV